LDESTASVGITDHAQRALGDVVYVSLPAVGATVTAGEPCGEVESTKSVSDIYSPVDGEVTEINEEIDADPGLANADPYVAARPRTGWRSAGGPGCGTPRRASCASGSPSCTWWRATGSRRPCPPTGARESRSAEPRRAYLPRRSARNTT